MKKTVLFLMVLITMQSLAQKMPIQILPSGHIIVKANVDGKDGNFIFDTGGGINLLFDSFAKGLKQKGTYNFLTAHRATGERMDVPLFESKKITLANQEFKDVPYATFDLNLEGIDGLISLQMFKETDLVIDYIKKEILLTDLSTTENIKSFDIQLTTLADKTTDISTYIYLNNKYKIQVLLDSGAGNNSFWISDKFIDSLGIDRNQLEIHEKTSEFDATITTKFYRGSLHTISNDHVSLKDPKVVFVEGLIYEGKTSINWFGNRIGISLKNKKFYILD